MSKLPIQYRYAYTYPYRDTIAPLDASEIENRERQARHSAIIAATDYMAIGKVYTIRLARDEEVDEQWPRRRVVYTVELREVEHMRLQLPYYPDYTIMARGLLVATALDEIKRRLRGWAKGGLRLLGVNK